MITIVHDTPSGHYVLRERDRYTVCRDAGTHADTDSSYSRDADGLSNAIARCNYIERGAVLHFKDCESACKRALLCREALGRADIHAATHAQGWIVEDEAGLVLHVSGKWWKL